jgi:DNA integrity scanning protein DisA with diadenylate cyclase activity
MNAPNGFHSLSDAQKVAYKGKAKRPATTKEEVAKAATDALQALEKVAASLEEVNTLLSTVRTHDATFSTRDSLITLLDSLEDINVKSVVRDIHKVVKSRLMARANEG